ncbi:MAG: hypothetical protein ACT452_13780 [Microthrixaceae bacterium]
MHVRRIVAATGLAVMLSGLGSYQAQADHCTPMLMFSGVTVTPAAAGPKLNPGASSCITDDENVNPNYFTPGANSLSVGITADPAAALDPDGSRKAGAVETGWVTITYLDPVTSTEGQQTIPLSLTWSGTRWNSPSFTMPGPLVRATAEVLTQPGVVVSVTYRALGEDS